MHASLYLAPSPSLLRILRILRILTFLALVCLLSLILSQDSQESTLPNSAQVHAAIQMRLP